MYEHPYPRNHDETAGVVVVLSGGQDSTTCLAWALKHFHGPIHCVTFNYGQRHAIELDAAANVVAYFRKAMGRYIEHAVIDIPRQLLRGTSPLVSDSHLEQYKDHSSLPGGLEKTFVPMRNQTFLTIAANYAFVEGIDTLVTGVCEEDFGGYPDCRRVFIDLLTDAINAGTFNAEAGFARGITIETPLMNLTKAQSVLMAADLPGAYEALALTHTAYDGRFPPTGHDHASLLRAKGFMEAEMPDPLVLRAVSEGLMPMPQTHNYNGPIVSDILASRDIPGVGSLT